MVFTYDCLLDRDLGVRAADAASSEKLLASQPDAGEQALEIVESLVRSGAVDLIVVDSVAALVPQAEIDGEMGDAASKVAALREAGVVIAESPARVAATMAALL